MHIAAFIRIIARQSRITKLDIRAYITLAEGRVHATAFYDF